MGEKRIFLVFICAMFKPKGQEKIVLRGLKNEFKTRKTRLEIEIFLKKLVMR